MLSNISTIKINGLSFNPHTLTGASLSDEPEFLKHTVSETVNEYEIELVDDEFDLFDLTERHTGTTPGCFWTEWRHLSYINRNELVKLILDEALGIGLFENIPDDE